MDRVPFDSPAAALSDISLGDRFDLTKSPVLLNGAQAVARLLLAQKERDRRAKLNTAGFISGYRGSPVGGLDLQFTRLAKLFKANDIHFEPGLNEELAATAVWGAQQAEMRGEGRFDGVFSLWYGKGPGVDRCGDVFRHANLAGTSPHGGVLALMGDDHTAESSTTAHQSEFAFVDVMMPILSPAGVQEVLDYGALGWALSRYAGVWVGLKCIKDTIESTAVVDTSLDRVTPIAPADFPMPPGGLNIRTPDGILEQEARLQEHKRAAVVAWIAANKLNRIIASGGSDAKIGIITLGKSYLDTRQALDDLGIDEIKCNELGLRLYKLGCAWPIEPVALREFARGLSLIIVVEEKRSLIEVQVREELYGEPNQPTCIGKKDEAGNWLFPVKGALDPNDIAIAIGERLLKFHPSDELAARVAHVRRSQAALADIKEVAARTPYFCSGCPHNRSTVIPEGARAYAGIGCHFMAQYMDRGTDGFTQMGGEGANWIGESHFSKRGHVFQNLGDGTYNHSGALALRWSIDSKVNVTYKILFNDAVAMTGGQRHEGGLNVPQIARQVAADGAKRVVVVADDISKYPTGTDWPAGVTLRARDDLIAVEKELSEVSGATVLIYDQTCAAEKRRRRKRGEYPDPDKRVIINELVCEGCGDCGVKSNCVSIQPLETEFGRKRAIDQSSCNKDFSCADGFCPSFVTVHGAKPKRIVGKAKAAPPSPEPVRREIGDKPYSIIVTGVGGTGVVTIGAIIGMAAHLEGKGCGMIDMAGLAQKGGAVFSHVKLARKPEDIHAIRVAAGDADLILGCDLVVSGAKKVLAAVRGVETGFIVNSAELYPGDFTRNADYSLPGERLKRSISAASGGGAKFVDATAAANALVGNAIGANMFVLGYAYQAGYVPVSAEAIRRAIELNGEAVAMNLAAFDWGRAAAADPATVGANLRSGAETAPVDEQSLEAIVARRAGFLMSYQNAAYSGRYKQIVAQVADAETKRAPNATGLAKAVARNLFKLMAYKDEYEVARLYTDGSFQKQVAQAFEGDLRFEFHLAPPLLARKDSVTGEAKKMSFGPWMMKAFQLLATLRFLRGTKFDIFGYSEDRREERALIADYEALCRELVVGLTPGNHAIALSLAALPERIRGYGHVKARSVAGVREEWDRLLEAWRAPPVQRQAAE
ncbi:indolepyruvate ferredoxin oxidoreductase family protein [Methylocapsa sp. S129]|uniref:indolepyruvate ferredoxin oxidoreductase family protein n=1 Tax=Methylocapsa sp. S129 TaxID=1641869 RepID=UPI00131D80F4|nr:indolepyruvate ferredoxin oxidoreductase family protein [Methylocapsa sp. S129]